MMKLASVALCIASAIAGGGHRHGGFGKGGFGKGGGGGGGAGFIAGGYRTGGYRAGGYGGFGGFGGRVVGYRSLNRQPLLSQPLIVQQPIIQQPVIVQRQPVFVAPRVVSAPRFVSAPRVQSFVRAPLVSKPIVQTQVEERIETTGPIMEKEVNSYSTAQKIVNTHKPVFHRTTYNHITQHDTVNKDVIHHVGETQQRSMDVAGKMMQGGKTEINHGDVGHQAYNSIASSYSSGSAGTVAAPLIRSGGYSSYAYGR